MIFSKNGGGSLKVEVGTAAIFFFSFLKGKGLISFCVEERKMAPDPEAIFVRLTLAARHNKSEWKKSSVDIIGGWPE